MKEEKLMDVYVGALWWKKKISFYVNWKTRSYRYNITPLWLETENIQATELDYVLSPIKLEKFLSDNIK